MIIVQQDTDQLAKGDYLIIRIRKRLIESQLRIGNTWTDAVNAGG